MSTEIANSQAQSENDRRYWFDDFGEESRREYLNWLSVQNYKLKHKENGNVDEFFS